MNEFVWFAFNSYPKLRSRKTQLLSINSGKQLSKNKSEEISQFITLISEFLKIEEKPPTKSVFKFEISEQAHSK